MPISVALPAPQIEYEQELYCPAFTAASSFPQTAANLLEATALRATQARATTLTATAGAINSLTGYGGVGSVGVINRIEQRHGRPCVRVSLTGTTQGTAIIPPDWNAVFGAPAASLNPGSLQDPAAIVSVWDWHLSVALGVGAAPSWPNDTSGVFFLPDGTGLDVRNNPPGGVGPRSSGFGVFLNNVGGVARWEYVSFTAAAILERVTIGASIVPLVTDWSTVRFVIVSAGSGGRSPSLSVQVNGFDIVTGRVFGGVSLADPIATAGTAGLCAALSVWGAAVPDQLFYALSAKLGRFTPSGSELQGD